MTEGILYNREPVRLRQCRYGPMLYLTTDRYIGRSLDNYGEFSEGETQLFRQLLRPGQTVVDVGANIGVHTVFFGQAVGPSGQVYAFEPQRLVFQLLCANLALNGLLNVQAHQAALGREASTVSVPCLDPAQLQNFGGLSLQGAVPGESVPLWVLDELSLTACDLLKIDVEGMEGEVLAGARQTIERFQPVIYVENDRHEHSAALIDQLFAYRYRLYWHLPPMFNRDNFFATQENVFGRVVSVNMLAIPENSQIQVEGFRQIWSSQESWEETKGTSL